MPGRLQGLLSRPSVSYRHSLLDQLLACSGARSTATPSKTAAELREEFEACKDSLPEGLREFIEAKLKVAETRARRIATARASRADIYAERHAREVEAIDAALVHFQRVFTRPQSGASGGQDSRLYVQEQVDQASLDHANDHGK